MELSMIPIRLLPGEPYACNDQRSTGSNPVVSDLSGWLWLGIGIFLIDSVTRIMSS